MSRILVTGATGNVGKFLIHYLLQSGHTVRAFCRNPEKVDFPKNVEIFSGDITKKEDVSKALENIDKAFLLMSNDHGSIFSSCLDSVKIKHVVLLSSYTVEIDWPSKSNYIANHHIEGESLLIRNKIPYTFLRPSGFMTSAFQWMDTIKSLNKAFIPFPDSAHSVIHPEDIALCASKIFENEEHIGKSYLLTGPELLTPRDQITIISKHLGKEIEIIKQSQDEIKQSMSKNLPSILIDSILELLESKPKVIDVSDNLKSITKTKGFTFSNWVKENIQFFQ